MESIEAQVMRVLRTANGPREDLSPDKRTQIDTAIARKTALPYSPIQEDWRNLQLIEDQAQELCLAAVTMNGHALGYVKNQTPEICMAAVTQDGTALYYVKEQTPELCWAAIEQDWGALHYVKNQTLELSCWQL